jgi:hypothetical protein
LPLIALLRTAHARQLEVVRVVRVGSRRLWHSAQRSTSRHEQHLFLWVRRPAFSFPTYDNLTFGGTLPAEKPGLPEGLSEIWLASGFADGGVVRGIANSEWRRDQPFD